MSWSVYCRHCPHTPGGRSAVASSIGRLRWSLTASTSRGSEISPVSRREIENLTDRAGDAAARRHCHPPSRWSPLCAAHRGEVDRSVSVHEPCQTLRPDRPTGLGLAVPHQPPGAGQDQYSNHARQRQCEHLRRSRGAQVLAVTRPVARRRRREIRGGHLAVVPAAAAPDRRPPRAEPPERAGARRSCADTGPPRRRDRRKRTGRRSDDRHAHRRFTADSRHTGSGHRVDDVGLEGLLIRRPEYPGHPRTGRTPRPGPVRPAGARRSRARPTGSAHREVVDRRGPATAMATASPVRSPSRPSRSTGAADLASPVS